MSTEGDLFVCVFETMKERPTGGATFSFYSNEREAIGKTAKEKVIIYFETKSNRKNIVIADVK